MTKKEQIKNTGATFTPPSLAEYLAERLMKLVDLNDEIKVLDPACGDGELLVAIGNSLLKNCIKFSLTGFDSNLDYITVAEERSLAFKPNHTKFIYGDFLESIDLADKQLSLNFDLPEKRNSIIKYADVIIANPPYVRTQILGAKTAQKLAKKFNLKGRVDLYYPFLIAMTECLKENGLLGVITSNRYLSTKAGEGIRSYFAENYEIIEIIDLGDTKIFDAAVLPAIFIGRKRKVKKKNAVQPKFTKIYEESNGYVGKVQIADSVYDILNNKFIGYFQIGTKRYKKTNGTLFFDPNKKNSWEMLSDIESNWVNAINSNALYRVGDLFKVRVGIKTTADKIFISDQWDSLGSCKPEEELLRDLISQENIQPWKISNKVTLRVLYTHFDIDGKKRTIDIDKYPQAKNYFLAFENQLKQRKYLIDAGRKWFEIWVPQNPALWSKPKLVFPDISQNPRFCFDTEGKIVNGNCYWIVADNNDDIDKLLLIQGVANSELMTRYHDLVFNNKLYSGRRRYFAQYVERYPLPDIQSNTAKEIIKIVKQLNARGSTASVNQLIENLEFLVSKAFGVPIVSIQD